MTDTTELQPQLIAVRELAKRRTDVEVREDYGYFKVGKGYFPRIQGYWDVVGSPFGPSSELRLIARDRFGAQVARVELANDNLSGSRLIAVVNVLLSACR